ncbi:acyl carrier protein [Aquisalimonas sp. 2447]|uniref:acyl carrier protein n=1 Tax=Aquisalimonas sp. 2447 TaxID=2740807 RepID=UPI00143274E4|nr:acyl carrier protein [Aquisalimonas sp. 2447]QIT56535.1 acyl carrier protein [Aquisalimonas sp. 2447]
MPTQEEVKSILDEALALEGRALEFDRDTELLGGVPEFDSMAVVSLIAAMEERFGIVVDDDDITAETFETVGTLVDFVQSKHQAQKVS